MVSRILQMKINRYKRFARKHKQTELFFTHGGSKFRYGLLTDKVSIWIPDICEWREVEERE